jgi:hypothetical protein
MARYDDLNTGSIAYATFVGSILLLIIILLVRALCYSWIDSEDARKLNDGHYASSDAVISEQKARISGTGKETVTVPPPVGQENAQPTQVERLRIPVDQAKDLLLKEMGAEPST